MILKSLTKNLTENQIDNLFPFKSPTAQKSN